MAWADSDFVLSNKLVLISWIFHKLITTTWSQISAAALHVFSSSSFWSTNRPTNQPGNPFVCLFYHTAAWLCLIFHHLFWFIIKTLNNSLDSLYLNCVKCWKFSLSFGNFFRSFPMSIFFRLGLQFSSKFQRPMLSWWAILVITFNIWCNIKYLSWFLNAMNFCFLLRRNFSSLNK